MARRLILGLDVGTSMVHTIIAEYAGLSEPRVLGIGIAPALGIRKGVVIDLEEATNSIQTALGEATTEAKVELRGAYVAIGGSHLSVSSSRGVVAVSRTGATANVLGGVVLLAEELPTVFVQGRQGLDELSHARREFLG